jgi:hypothetical protein
MVDVQVTQGECARTHKGLDERMGRMEEDVKEINEKQDKQMKLLAGVAQYNADHEKMHNHKRVDRGNIVIWLIALGAVIVSIIALKR